MNYKSRTNTMAACMVGTNHIPPMYLKWFNKCTGLVWSWSLSDRRLKGRVNLSFNVEINVDFRNGTITIILQPWHMHTLTAVELDLVHELRAILTQWHGRLYDDTISMIDENKHIFMHVERWAKAVSRIKSFKQLTFYT